MAINDWKSFLMPYEQAVDELKVKLRSIRKEYRKKKNTLQLNLLQEELRKYQVY